MFSNNKYVDRLVRQYLEHDNLVIAVDFDDTIFPGNVNHAGDLKPIIETLKESSTIGFKNVIYTARNKKYFPEILQFCKDNEIDVWGINEDVVKLKEPTSGKIYYNLFLDDKAGLEEAHKILCEAIEIIKTMKFSEDRG